MNTLEWLDARVKDLDRNIQLMDEVIKIIDQMLVAVDEDRLDEAMEIHTKLHKIID